MARAPVFSHNNGNRGRIYEIVVSKNVYPLRHDASFYPSFVSFCLQITYGKVGNSRIGVNKACSIGVDKFITSCIASAACVEVVHLNKLIYKRILLLQLPYCVSVLLLTSGCKSAAAQYKRSYHLAPPQNNFNKINVG